MLPVELSSPVELLLLEDEAPVEDELSPALDDDDALPPVLLLLLLLDDTGHACVLHAVCRVNEVVGQARPRPDWYVRIPRVCDTVPLPHDMEHGPLETHPDTTQSMSGHAVSSSGSI